jgi:hypothetical protein
MPAYTIETERLDTEREEQGRPYCALSHLRRAVLPLHKAEAVWMVMASAYTAYFDDGGHPDDQPVVLVSGFISTADQWEAFSEDWCKMLARYGVASGYLHMTDLRSRKLDYEGWPDERCSQLLNEAAAIIRVRARKSFATLVPMEDYARVNQNHALEECLGTPYGFAARYIMDKLKDWHAAYNRQDWPLLTVFEDGTKHKGDLLSLFERDGLRAPVFAKKKEAVPLQACDWLSWEMFSWFRNGAHEKSVNEHSPFGKILRVPYEHYVWTQSVFEHECSEAVVPRRSQIGPNTRIFFASEKKRPRRRTIYLEPGRFPNHAELFDEANKERIQKLRRNDDPTSKGSA